MMMIAAATDTMIAAIKRQGVSGTASLGRCRHILAVIRRGIQTLRAQLFPLAPMLFLLIVMTATSEVTAFVAVTAAICAAAIVMISQALGRRSMMGPSLVTGRAAVTVITATTTALLNLFAHSPFLVILFFSSGWISG